MQHACLHGLYAPSGDQYVTARETRETSSVSRRRAIIDQCPRKRNRPTLHVAIYY